MYYAVMPALAVALNAKVVVIENVPGIEHDRRQILNHAKGLFTAGHYLVDERIINAVEVGLPQTRKRHVLIASRTRKPDIDTVIQALARNETDLRWAIEDLASIESDDPIDASGELSIENRRRIDHLFDNDEYDLVDYMRPGAIGTATRTRRSTADSIGICLRERLRPDSIRPDEGGTSIHPNDER